MTDTQLDNAIKTYLAGKSVEDAAKFGGVNDRKLRQTLKERRLTRSKAESRQIAKERMLATKAAKRRQYTPEIVRRYTNGESEKSIADSLPGKLSRVFVRGVLLEAGINPRNPSQANWLRVSQMTPAQKKAQTAKANKASRGRKISWEEKCAQALGKQAACVNQSPLEVKMLEWLREIGIGGVPQQAIGAYNADIGVAPVAVEIFGGNFHAAGRHAARFPQRCHYFFDQGWSGVFVWVNAVSNPLTIDAAKYVASFIEAAKSDPSLIGQYRMIGGRGQLFATGSLDCDDFTSVLARCASLNASRGNDHPRR